MTPVLYWNANELQRKLDEFKIYFNESRVHLGIKGKTPNQQGTLTELKIADLHNIKTFSVTDTDQGLTARTLCDTRFLTVIDFLRIAAG